VPHYTPEATALRMTVGGKTIAYSGDSAWTDTLLEVGAAADLFICQTYTIDIPQSGLLNYRTRARRNAGGIVRVRAPISTTRPSAS